MINSDISIFFDYCHASSLSLSHRRGLVLNLLYTLEMNDYDLTVIELLYSYNIDFGIIIDNTDDIVFVVEEIIKNNEVLDAELKQYLEHWQLERLSVLVKLILRYGMFEIREKRGDVKLVINEAVELAKGYAEENSYRFVNGVLDTYAKRIINNIK